MINLILLRVALMMSDGQMDVDIIPEYPIATTTFYDNRSFGGVVDFLVAKLPARYTRKDNGQCVRDVGHTKSFLFVSIFARRSCKRSRKSGWDQRTRHF